MITRVRIRGYRKFRSLDFRPHPTFNVLVGNNQAGKSTLLEAIGMAVTGRINGRTVSEELNPHWFHAQTVAEYLAARARRENPLPPEIFIEVTLQDRSEFAPLIGADDLDKPSGHAPGVRLRIRLNPEYRDEFSAYVSEPGTKLLPTEYFTADWRSFQGNHLTQRPRALAVAVIDSRTVRSTAGVDYHLRQVIGDNLTDEERAAVSAAFRRVKENMTAEHLGDVNTKLAAGDELLDGGHVALAMDHSSRTSWDSSVVPHVDDVPFLLAGQGQQAVTKIVLAMRRHANAAGAVMIEEPENHLSHSNLNVLLDRIDTLSHDEQQVFVATHSSFVLNRLGLDRLRLVSDGDVRPFAALPEDTVNYFRKLPGFDTLRLVLAQRMVLVEGPSDELLFERFYRDRWGRRPIDDGIDVFSMRGLSHRRFLELAKLVGKRCVILSDNDGRSQSELDDARIELGDLLNDDRVIVFGDVACGHTLEPQVLNVNDANTLRAILGTPRANLETWMGNNKTDAALKIFSSPTTITSPSYFTNALEFIHDSRR
ncbi:ATP-dependent endonuclease [Cryobacterium sp. TMT3-29-2]|uniref:ATP-dependent nuclease n=2 Tax=Microbacteriaceae TaxID=85023 RepID=UPI00107379DF|nr:AAA family ATPase [Cryobacterium sp. TMT3-29-2]TFC83034.1 ATP-dependent endonuclease [Cryobacterium sp. TMT3-29-2]